MPDVTPLITQEYLRIQGFKSWSAAWELGVFGIVRDELARRGYLELGAMFEYWRGEHDEREWSETLEALGRATRSRVARSGARAGCRRLGGSASGVAGRAMGRPLLPPRGSDEPEAKGADDAAPESGCLSRTREVLELAGSCRCSFR